MPGRILIVEDNDKNRLLLRDLLNYYGYEIIEAENGEAGITKAREYKPDLILMDIQMPVMDGFSAIINIKNDPELKDIKIIAVTSFAMAEEKEKIMKTGVDDYISKPIDIKELPEKIRTIIKG